MENLLPEDEARRVGLEFIQGIYYRGKVTIHETRLVRADASPVYHLEGTIKVPSRSMLGRFIATDAPYTISMKIDAVGGSILNYEVK